MRSGVGEVLYGFDATVSTLAFTESHRQLLEGFPCRNDVG